MERRSLPLGALYPDPSAHQLAQAFADGKAEAGAAVLAGSRGVQLGERLKQGLEPVARDADSGVLHRQMEFPPVFGNPTGGDPNEDAASVGELEAVGQQIDQDLTAAHGIANRGFGGAVLDPICQVETFAGGVWRHQIEGVLDRGAQIEGSQFQFQLHRLDLREVENVVQDVEQRFTADADGFQVLSSGGTASTIQDERFLPEEMDAWELGTKTSWEAAGGLQVNGSVFFNDYTDKQWGGKRGQI